MTGTFYLDKPKGFSFSKRVLVQKKGGKHVKDVIKQTVMIWKYSVYVTSLHLFVRLKLQVFMCNHSNGGMSQLLVTGLRRQSAGWSFSAMSQSS